MPASDDAFIQLGAIDSGECDACGMAFSHGGAMRAPSGIGLVALCQWCLAVWLTDLTGFGVVQQLLAWESTRSHRNPARWETFRRATIRPGSLGGSEGGDTEIP